jgi:hypothetical protein
VAGPVAKLKSRWTAAANSILPRVRGAPENIAQGAARAAIFVMYFSFFLLISINNS